jgi:phosphoribosylaminoimidazole-succinocarboxamide synthase
VLSFQNQTNFYKGKVRDVYTIKDKYLVMKTSNRISAFDVILPKEIPYKGQVLNQVANYFLEATKHIIPNWVIDSKLSTITIGKKCSPLPIEVVVRGYLAGHAAREYSLGKRTICGVPIAEGLQENDKFEYPIITPTTKANIGHDEDISKENIILNKLVDKQIYKQIEAYALALYNQGQVMAHKQGLILVDTKYEFGMIGDTIVLMDEIHTPDSSRYFYLDTYQELQQKRLPQRQLSKEFVRQWLIANNFQGKAGQEIPTMSNEWIQEISDRYIELHEKIIGKPFIKKDLMTDDEIQNYSNNVINQLD